MAAVERPVRRRRERACNRGGLRKGQKDAAIHASGRGSRGIGRNQGLACPRLNRLIYSGCPAPFVGASRTQHNPDRSRQYPVRGSWLVAEDGSTGAAWREAGWIFRGVACKTAGIGPATCWMTIVHASAADRKSTRLNSSHSQISYAVFCLKKKKKQIHTINTS